MKELLLVVALAATLASTGRATAQVYPSSPITMIVPFAAGGPTDTLARILGEGMKAKLGQPVIIENVTGAGATLGVGRAARAAPDGYTLSIGNWSSHVGSPALYPIAFDILKDLEPVSLLTIGRLLLVGKTALPANDVTELIAWLKANPDKGTAATVGAGSGAHLCGIYFQEKTGTSLQFVPYRGGAPALQDLIAGQIDLMCSEASNALPHVRGGKIKAYAVMGKTRWSAAPDIPTMDEAGVPGLYISFWHGLWVQRGTPADVIGKLDAAVVDTLTDPIVRKRLTEMGQEIPPPEDLTPAALRAFHKAETERWWPIIKAANIKAE